MIKVESPSPNFSERHNLINAIVIHDSESRDVKSTISWFASVESKVSAHFIIDKDGTVYQCVAEDRVAWHAGQSELWGIANVNDYSLGIELVDDDDREKYPEQQLDSLINLTTELVTKYKIQLNRIVGHQHIALPLGRKKDPGPDFPWYEFLYCIGARVANSELRGS